MFHRLALIGCGLMGGSLSLAMQRAGLVQHVIGYSPNPATVQEALRRGVLTETAGTAGQAVAHADLVRGEGCFAVRVWVRLYSSRAQRQPAVVEQQGRDAAAAAAGVSAFATAVSLLPAAVRNSQGSAVELECSWCTDAAAPCRHGCCASTATQRSVASEPRTSNRQM